MKTGFRQSPKGRSGHVALVFFLLAYGATMALVIAPEQIKSVLDTP